MPRASWPPCRAGGHKAKGEGIARGGAGSLGAARCGGLVAPLARLTGRRCAQRWDAVPMHRPMQCRPHANAYGWAVMNKVYHGRQGPVTIIRRAGRAQGGEGRMSDRCG